MTALVSVSPETAQGVRDARHVLGRLAEAGFDFDEHGVLSLALIVDDLDVLLNMIDDARDDSHSRKPYVVRPLTVAEIEAWGVEVG